MKHIGEAMNDFGKKIWLIPDCYYPLESTAGPYVSHEAVCILNVTDEDAEISITAYYEDQEPDGSFSAVCPARRTSHIRMDRIKNLLGKGLDRARPYAMLIRSSVPVVCQYSRVDTTQERLGLATTIAYGL